LRNWKIEWTPGHAAFYSRVYEKAVFNRTLGPVSELTGVIVPVHSLPECRFFQYRVCTSNNRCSETRTQSFQTLFSQFYTYL
jgi:hypothetical protein